MLVVKLIFSLEHGFPAISGGLNLVVRGVASLAISLAGILSIALLLAWTGKTLH